MNETKPAGELTHVQIDQCWDSKVSGYGRSRYDIARAIIAADRALRQAGQDDTAEAVNDTNAILATRYFELLKAVEKYEQHGVTCQTYQHFIDTPCAECNVAPQPAPVQAGQEPVGLGAFYERWRLQDVVTK